jgi:ubiquinone/menaquinone biosynthesis C-methylase UbiE
MDTRTMILIVHYHYLIEEKIKARYNFLKRLRCNVLSRKAVMALAQTKQSYALDYDYWVKRNSYYHSFIACFYQFMIPKNSRVLQVGCKTGYLLNSVQPCFGLGVDSNSIDIKKAQENYHSLQFQLGTVKDIPPQVPFDYIIISTSIMDALDIQELFHEVQRFCHGHTRIIIDTYSSLWEPLLRITQKLGLRRGTNLKNWLSPKDLKNLLHLEDFEAITHGRQLLIPCYIPLLSWFVNSFIAPLPLINSLCLSNWLIARPKPLPKLSEEFSVSVIIPCRNEAGNIESAIQRTPQLGNHTEFIFVEGNSVDTTREEIQRIQNKYVDKDISWYVQDGKGKGDAVRKGFDKAKGDILLILDADLTTPPEEMPKFINAIAQGKGDFINGSRLMYGMEKQAMRFANMIANHGFSIGFSWLLGQPIKDTLCGTKVLFKKDYETIARNRSFFGDFDPFGDFDLLFGAAKQHFKIVDMPIHYKNRTYGTTQIKRWRSGFMLLYMSWIAFKKCKIHSRV